MTGYKARVARVAFIVLALMLGACWSASQRLLANDSDLDSFPGSFGIYRAYYHSTTTCAERLAGACYEAKERVAIESILFFKSIAVVTRGSDGATSQSYLSMRRLSGNDFLIEQLLVIDANTRTVLYGIATVADREVRVWQPSCSGASDGPDQVIAARAGAYLDQTNHQCTFYSLYSLQSAASQYRDFVASTNKPPDRIYVFQNGGTRSSL